MVILTVKNRKGEKYETANKKLCAMLIAGTMLFSMVGCSGTESKENTKEKPKKKRIRIKLSILVWKKKVQVRTKLNFHGIT